MGDRAGVWLPCSLPRSRRRLGDPAAAALGDRGVSALPCAERSDGSKVLGLGATGEGQRTTTKTTSNILEAHEIQPAPEGSLESLARASGIPRFLLDLRRAIGDCRLRARNRHDARHSTGALRRPHFKRLRLLGDDGSACKRSAPLRQAEQIDSRYRGRRKTYDMASQAQSSHLARG